VTSILRPGIHNAFGPTGSSVGLSRGRSVYLHEGVSRNEVAERPASPEGEFREVGDVVTAADPHGHAVGRVGLDLGNRLCQEANRGVRRAGRAAVSDFDEERRKLERRTVMGRFERRPHSDSRSALVQEAKRRRHTSGVGRHDRSGPSSDFGARARIAQRVNGEARDVHFASVDGRKEERGTLLSYGEGKLPVEVLIVNVMTGATEE